MLVLPHIAPHHLHVTSRHIMTKMYLNLYQGFKIHMFQTYFNLNGSIEVSIFNRGRGGRVMDGGSGLIDKVNNNIFSGDLQAGRSVLSAYLNSSYMNLDMGSALIFWRWPNSLQYLAREGFPSQLIHNLPSNLKRPKYINADDRLKLLKKSVDV